MIAQQSAAAWAIGYFLACKHCATERTGTTDKNGGQNMIEDIMFTPGRDLPNAPGDFAISVGKSSSVHVEEVSEVHFCLYAMKPDGRDDGKRAILLHP